MPTAITALAVVQGMGVRFCLITVRMSCYYVATAEALKLAVAERAVRHACRALHEF